MWYKIADFVLKYKIILLVIILGLTTFMGFQARKVELSYDFTNAIPTNNPQYIKYQNLIKTFGADANTVLIAVPTDKLKNKETLKDFIQLNEELKQVKYVLNVLSLSNAVNITKDSLGKLAAPQIYPNIDSLDYYNLDSIQTAFYNLPFYKGLLYNNDNTVSIIAVQINKDVLRTKGRTTVINGIKEVIQRFETKHNIELNYSGLPFIRTETANIVQHELTLFLVLSFLLTAIILLLFFRSLLAVLISMIVVGIGVILSFGTIQLLGYKLTILTGIIPPLIVVIGIPNCVYFLNKYHLEYAATENKILSLRNMVGKMSIVTLFTNLTTAIGFGVFFFTKSVILKEFGLVAGINILVLFIISLIIIPAVYSLLPSPNTRHTSYLDSKPVNKVLDSVTLMVFKKRYIVYIATSIIAAIAIWGVTLLRAEGFIVDDLPKNNKIYTDLKFFEKNFKGVMPLEIVIDTKKKFGAVNSLALWQKIDSLGNMLESYPEIGSGLTLIKGVKFARQGFMGGEESQYRLPNSMEFGQIKGYLVSSINKMRKNEAADTTRIAKLLTSFLDKDAQRVRLSVNIADIGSVEMPKLLAEIQPKAEAIFADDDVELTFTGASITFLEGSTFIINSLKESLVLAFLMIVVCMIILFRNWKMVIIAIITNLIPLAITAGIMGFLDIPLKPSTVLVFSLALGITVDVTIRFLTNFKQELILHKYNIKYTLRSTIQDTGLSIILTTLILVAGFGVFVVSNFDGTKALGFLTSITLFLSMVFNLTLLPALMLWMEKAKNKKSSLSGKL